MHITKDHSIAESVANNYQAATVFKKYQIDFCCGGKISIEDASKKANIDLEKLLQELNEATHESSQVSNAEDYELDDLVSHIITVHHSYVRKRIPEIEPFLEKVVQVHGQKHPELKKVQENFQAIKAELLSHMQVEESVLFPYIKAMVSTKNSGTKLQAPSFGTIKEPIKAMEMEHESAGDKLKEIRQITNNLTLPDGACSTYRVTFSLLEEFESDLHRHIHLENNVLFPKSIILENSLL